MADQQTPQEFGKKLRDTVGLPEDNIKEILREGLLGFNATLPQRPSPDFITTNPIPLPGRVDITDVQTQPIPSSSFSSKALQVVDPQSSGTGETFTLTVLYNGGLADVNFPGASFV